MTEILFAALFGVTLGGMVLAVVAGVALLAFPWKSATRQPVSSTHVPARP